MEQQSARLLLRVGGVLSRIVSRSSHLKPALESPICQHAPPIALIGSAAPWSIVLARRYSVPAHTLMAMPSLSPTMTQGNIAVWKLKEGDKIAPGTVLAEIETDKATMEWEAQEEGFLAKIVKEAGSKDIPVGGVVAVLVEEASDVAAFKDFQPGAASSAPPPAEPQQKASIPEPAPPPAAQPPAAAASSWPPHQVLNMPSLSPTMSQGNILEWKKQVGDAVTAGEVYVDVETDKATMAWEAQEDGFIAKLLLASNAKDVPVGTPAVVMVEDKASVAAFKDFTEADAKPGSKPQAAPAAPAPPSQPQQQQAAPAPSPQPSSPAPAAAAPHPTSGDRVRASPYARKLAAQAGVSLAGLQGSGPGGRIVSEDVNKAVATGKAAPTPAPQAVPTAGAAPASPSVSGSEYLDIPHTQIRRVTAKRLLESKQTIPHYYLTTEIKLDAMTKLRAQVNASFPSDSKMKISVNDFVIKAAALALRKVSGVNASWQPDFIRQYARADISVAVQSPIGLMTPIVKDAGAKGLATISSEVKALAQKAKDGKLAPAEFMGGTFTISNLGMYGVKQFAAIVNPPQAAILAVGAADKKVVMNKAGEYEEISVMLVTLSCDHRVIDGAMGAEWLQAFKGYMEQPFTMLL
ncbi:hypothetical protein QJQ45_025894 [Haematococcus lacustris]|nr:hypothetical protein QJQ45_025894 [Haematococcus lacustris]